jgi:hypothetical protein
VAKRRKFSRWRRLPGVYRFGDDKPPDPNLEPQRLSLYITGLALDRAESQATRLGFATVQEYCADLLFRAIDAEHVRGQVADVEARRGALEGLHEIAEDPEYLAELSAASSPREPGAPDPGPDPAGREPQPVRLGPDATGRPNGPVAEARPAAPPDRVAVRLESVPMALSHAALVVLRHAAQAEDDPHAFLPSLRRGDPVPASEVAELAQALHELELEYSESRTMDRRLTFALHRLAFESQILHTDAWPGAFDAWTVDMLRAVQEAVERILSGQDIRYYPDPGAPPIAPRPEHPL